MLLILIVALPLTSKDSAAQTPQATQLPGKPFFVKTTWTIGGEGNWDYLTLDPMALQLYIAHGPVVQVVDVNAGTVVGEVKGLRDAHQIALDDQGQLGYVSDGGDNVVRVFDRRTFEITATIPTGKGPRGVVFDAASRLVFAICPETETNGESTRQRNSTRPRNYDTGIRSTVTVIDADKGTHLADLQFPGTLGFAEGDGRGSVYVAITDRNSIAYFDAPTLGNRLRELAQAKLEAEKAEAAKAETSAGATTTSGAKIEKPKPPAASTPLEYDWGDGRDPKQPVPSMLHFIHLGSSCQTPRGLAVDGKNQRVFTSCENMKMEVLNASNGEVVATLPIGAGTDAIGYDPNRGLIYSSNGGGLGSLTIIRQDIEDEYAVIQELPTAGRARTLAVNPISGDVYLVTNIVGFDVNSRPIRKVNGLPVLPATAVIGSFRVMVVGN